MGPACGEQRSSRWTTGPANRVCRHPHTLTVFGKLGSIVSGVVRFLTSFSGASLHTTRRNLEARMVAFRQGVALPEQVRYAGSFLPQGRVRPRATLVGAAGYLREEEACSIPAGKLP